MKNEALIAGSSGLVGQKLLQLLLDSAHYSKIYSLVRKPSGIQHPKLEELIFDFNAPKNYENLPSVKDIFCCLGTTIKKAGSQEAFKKVDFEYPLLLAKAGKNNEAQSFHVITALGADANSTFFYNKVKGELQDALKKLNFDQLYIYQPSLLVGERSESRPGEKLAIKVMPLIELFLIGPLKKYKGIKVEAVAKAMLYTALNNHEKLKIILSDEIQTLADSHSPA